MQMIYENKIGFLLLLKSYLILKENADDFKIPKKKHNASFFSTTLSNHIKKACIEPVLTAGTLNNHFTKINNNKSFESITKATKVKSSLMKFCACTDDDQIKKIAASVQQQDIDSFLKAINSDVANIYHSELIFSDNVFSKYLIPDSVFEDLEFGKNGYAIEVNCITPNLKWAFEHIPKNKDKIKERENKYRYILTESINEDPYEKLARILRKNPEVAKRIEIKKLYERNEFSQIRKSGIILPMSNDIVIYRKINEEEDPEIIIAIIGARPYELPNEKNASMSIRIDDDRASILFNWFDDVWNLLPEIVI